MSDAFIQPLIACGTRCIFLADSLDIQKLIIKSCESIQINSIILPFDDREHHMEPVDVHHYTNFSIQPEYVLLAVFDRGYQVQIEHVNCERDYVKFIKFKTKMLKLLTSF